MISIAFYDDYYIIEQRKLLSFKIYMRYFIFAFIATASSLLTIATHRAIFSKDSDI